MSRHTRFLIAGLAVLLAGAVLTPGCSSSDNDLTIADFAGTWDATSYRVTSKANPALTMDLIALGGAMTATVEPSGIFSGSASIPDPATMQVVTVPLAGAFVLEDQETLTIDFRPDLPPFFTDETLMFTLSGNALTLEDDDTTFDWDEDGVPDPSTFRGTLQRR